MTVWLCVLAYLAVGVYVARRTIYSLATDGGESEPNLDASDAGLLGVLGFVLALLWPLVVLAYFILAPVFVPKEK